ncbi:retinal rod rhodopsin-sensitive cGMP 3',5'-cyclic phosphodiesterase subunit delta-like [Metopolophium dirhodum]|uniref:retinal rod rhodopsin-sensitive cGMP 3',5'-cyclic phosphodiesterase subunit delta-like n=1 Tax=Metopolophium dirhodum TaxID=44670 RepID=UPI00298FC93B|nr:retinal rod rhodopsin-sensitive cGMP 3',5'-cyclic phosphodiesterase subunit delta-like [Metopolophium dirhodum]
MQLKSEHGSSGFHINWINMIDNDTGVVLWYTNQNYALPGIEHEAIMPRKVLDCRAMTRTISFSSEHRINHLKLKHKEFLQGCCIEEWDSEFGTVLAETAETWETIFMPREGSTSSSANVLSGNLLIETNFYDGDKLITTSNILIFYE